MTSQPQPDFARLLRERILPRVQKPARYLGGEWNQVVKDPRHVATRVALAFPDVYEIGISYLGYHLLYELLNQQPDVYAERAYSPWVDAEALLREEKIPLLSLETTTPLDQFHLVGITLQHEMSYTNVLNLLDLGRIPLLAAAREAHHPLVLAGGPCAANPEPLAAALDLVVLGDGEKVFLEIIRQEQALRHLPRQEKIRALSLIPGVYAPMRYQPVYAADGTLCGMQAEPGAPLPIRRRHENPPALPIRPVVPYLGITHDRVNAELFRGCTRGCRFCQAGMITRPLREKDPEVITRQLVEAVRQTGYEEVALTSLSSGDYTELVPLISALMQELAADRVALSFPSLRLDSFRRELAEAVRLVRKTGLTFAPEAGSSRLRDVINKNLDEAEMIEAVSQVFAEGWDLVKLYFMIGFPTETDDDIAAIARMVRKILQAGREHGSRRPARVNLSVNLFVPKPHTPFQWEPQLAPNIAFERFQQLTHALPRGVGFSVGKRQQEDLERSQLEAVLARGDRRLWPVVKRVWELGARFDSWGDLFQFPLWQQAFRELAVNPQDYANRTRSLDEVLPWAHLDMGVHQAFLKQEREKALNAVATPDCRDNCQGCGVADPGACYQPATPSRPANTPSWPDIPRPEREKVRYRLRYRKMGDRRFIGHLDLVNVFRRGARRAGLPLHYSVGFHPQPSLAFGPPLPLGYQAMGEWLDLGLDAWLEPEAVMQSWNAQLPDGLQFDACREIPLSTPALAQGCNAGEYQVFFPGVESLALQARLQSLEGAEPAIGTQWSKNGEIQVDLKPSYQGGSVLAQETGGATLRMLHATGLGSNAKAGTLVEYLCQGLIESWQAQITRLASGKFVDGRLLAP